VIATLIALQIVLPLALTAWLGLRPLHSGLGLALQMTTTALALLLLWRSGVWIVPPWWAVLVYAVLFAMAAAQGASRLRHLPRLPGGPAGWLGAASFVLLGGYFAFALGNTVTARRPPHGRIIDLQFPLSGGTFLVLNGGANLSVNAHADALDQSVPVHRAWWGTAYGVDFVAVDGWGFRASGLQPRELDAYRVFGMTVSAPCSGTVVVAIDGLPDMTPPEHDLANLAGNYVILACGDVHVLMGHFKRGTVAVRSGQAVAAGQAIGSVGNSGGSDEPHLHIHAQLTGSAEAPISGRPLPATFDGRYLVRGDFVRKAAEDSN
jgi:hypothetical protein